MHMPISQAEHVVKKLGGVNPSSRLLGHKHATTVQGWLKSGFIPGRHHAVILEKARAAGLELSEHDFIAHLQPVNAPPVPDPSGPNEDHEGGVAVETHARSCVPDAA